MIGFFGVSMSLAVASDSNHGYTTPTSYEMFAARLIWDLPIQSNYLARSCTPVQAERHTFLESLLQNLITPPKEYNRTLGSKSFLKGYLSTLGKIITKLNPENILKPISLDFVAYDSTIREMLISKKYAVLSDGRLVHKVIVQRERLPVIFGTFLSRSTEKERSIESLAEPLSVLAETFDKDLVLSDIGFGTSVLTQKVAEKLSPRLGNGFSLTINGIEQQKTYVANATERLKSIFPNQKIDLRQGNFLGEIPPDLLNKSSVILASHICYYAADKPQLIKRIQSFARHSGAVAIYIHEKSSAITDFRTKHQALLRPNSTENINHTIEKEIGKHPYHTDEFSYELIIPEITDEEWEKLKNIKPSDCENTYANERQEWREMKNLIEFFFMDPLEFFDKETTDLLINDFKKLVIENNHKIIITNQIFFEGIKVDGAKAIEKLKLQASKGSSSNLQVVQESPDENSKDRSEESPLSREQMLEDCLDPDGDGLVEFDPAHAEKKEDTIKPVTFTPTSTANLLRKY